MKNKEKRYTAGGSKKKKKNEETSRGLKILKNKNKIF